MEGKPLPQSCLNRLSWAGAPSQRALASAPVSARSAANGESEVMVGVYIFYYCSLFHF